MVRPLPQHGCRMSINLTMSTRYLHPTLSVSAQRTDSRGGLGVYGLMQVVLRAYAFGVMLQVRADVDRDSVCVAQDAHPAALCLPLRAAADALC